ncbi:MAG: hypothetical protein PWP70_446 [Moorella sp. (in: firmicutes)]|nr:hypothetical protein [Moorella sp. (in: firmicutes)]
MAILVSLAYSRLFQIIYSLEGVNTPFHMEGIDNF